MQIIKERITQKLSSLSFINMTEVDYTSSKFAPLGVITNEMSMYSRFGCNLRYILAGSSSLSLAS